MIKAEKLDHILNRFAYLEALLSDGLAYEKQNERVRLSKEYSDLCVVVDHIKTYRKVQVDITEAQALMLDPELKPLAEEEYKNAIQRLPAIEQQLQLSLLPKDIADDRSVVLEIRSGTGGEEAALFAADLARMYQRFAENSGWNFEMISFNHTELGGCRELVANIHGNNVFARMKFESGVHRVQRVPVTESSGRVHTSAATVAIMPQAQPIDIQINPNDLRIDTMRSSGAGGQHVNTTDSAVRITHLPSGIVTTSSQKSQHRNREIAMQVLRTRLYDVQRSKLAQQQAEVRKDQVGSGDRSQRIRTYNFPQGRLSDHRINLTVYKLEQIMQGNLKLIIDALITHDHADKLAKISL